MDQEGNSQPPGPGDETTSGSPPSPEPADGAFIASEAGSDVPSEVLPGGNQTTGSQGSDPSRAADGSTDAASSGAATKPLPGHRPATGPAMAKRHKRRRNRKTLGLLPLMHRLIAMLHLGAVIGAIAGFPLLLQALHQTPELLGAFAAPLGVLTLLTGGLAIATWRRGTVLRPGLPGRGRTIGAGAASLLFSIAAVPPVALLFFGAQSAIEAGYLFSYSLAEAHLALPGALRTALLVTAVVGGVCALLDLAVAIGGWFLLPAGFRRVFWLLTDASLVVSAAIATATLPIQPDAEGTLPAAVFRLTVTSLFLLRAMLRTLPGLFDLLETTGFQRTIAARHLRSKKSSFLAAIGTLSILAVALSTAMLVSVLNDLKQKILGNQAHVVVQMPQEQTFEGWEPTLEEARSVSGITGVTPFVAGEVMVTSTSNQTGALLRGIDVGSVSSVTDLERNLERGRLEYLQDPQRLLDLPPEERRTILPLHLEMPDEEAGDDETESEPGTALRDIEEAFAQLEEERAGQTADDTEGSADNESADNGSANNGTAEDAAENRDLLPGMIVGRELARTLRVFVGDELTVVSPFGALGPAGPMPKARRFRVAGIFYSGMYEYDMKLVYVTLPAAQRFLGTGDAISGLEVKVENVEEADHIAQTIAAALSRDDLVARDWKELNKNLFGALALEKLGMFVTLGIAILIAGFCVFGTLTLMVQEKGREVAILQAMGASPKDIIGVFLHEGLLIGLLGAGAGLGLGFLVTFVFEHFGFALNPEVYYIDRLPVHTDPMDFVVVGISAVAICVAATIFPAYVASRMRPVDALRYQ